MDPVKPDDRAYREVAEQRVEAYFRSHGLEDDDRIREAARAAVERARTERGAAGKSLPPAALDVAMADVDRWLGDLSAPLVTGERAAQVRGLLAWRLRPVLREQPGLFLAPVPEGGEASKVLESASAGIVPPESIGPMSPQSFGDVPVFLRSDVWSRFMKRLGRLMRRCADVFRRR